MTEKDLEEFEKEFGFKLLPTSFKKPLSEITKEEYRERVEYLYNAIMNDDSNDDLGTYEQEIKTLTKALDKACKYTHNNGLNGCPANFDIGAVDKKKKKECILCKFHCGFEKYFFNKEYEKKSKECWKEYFLKGKRK
ncbi:hypothetical protein [Holdemanella biformis]|uniref:hypothetical protein n=1 Tax=Holdemanella biformis TaxID=1735 RepID=UPI002665A5CB|nr:hypothetical protein [Holdemanella biformis]